MLRAALSYFAMVFSAGFVLGAIRTIWIVPRVGVRRAELMESPIMLGVTLLAARRIAHAGLAHPLGVGLVSLALLLAAELAMMRLRHLSVREYIANRDPVAGAAYVVLLMAFAVMPWLMSL